MLAQLRGLLAEAGFPWAVCGGYALELFAGKPIRTHGDLDVCVPEAARAAVISYLLNKGWRIHEYRGRGRVKPILVPEVALLYKVAQPQTASAQADFAAVYPLLDKDQRAWFQTALTARYPEGHPWCKEQE